MRTTLNIDDDLLRKLKREAERSRTSLTECVNRVLALGLERRHPATARKPYRQRTFAMGFPPIGSMDKALQLAAALEDEETVRELGLRR